MKDTSGKAEMIFQKAEELWENEKYEKANLLYFEAAELRHPKATYNLGFSYFVGMGVEKDYSKAVQYFEKA